MLKLQESNDEILLAAVAKGDKKAFDIIYERYWQAVFTEVYRRLKDFDDTKDIVQDVFLQLWMRKDKNPIRDLRAYLSIMARNCVFRYIKIQAKQLLELQQMPLSTDSQPADSIVISKELIDTFHTMLDLLPAQQRNIFKMRYLEDMKTENIAHTLGLSPKTIRNQLGRSLKKIKAVDFLFKLFSICFF